MIYKNFVCKRIMMSNGEIINGIISPLNDKFFHRRKNNNQYEDEPEKIPDNSEVGDSYELFNNLSHIYNDKTIISGW